MRMEICCVFDKVSELYALPMFVATKGVAVRMFTDEVNRVAGDNNLHLHPGDFVLESVGSWDNEKGDFVSFPKVVLCRGDIVKVGG